MSEGGSSLDRGRRLVWVVCGGALLLQLASSVLSVWVLEPPAEDPVHPVGISIDAVGHAFPYVVLCLVVMMLWIGESWARHVMAIYLATRITSACMATLLKSMEEPVSVLWWPWLGFQLLALVALILILLRSRALRAYLAAS